MDTTTGVIESELAADAAETPEADGGEVELVEELLVEEISIDGMCGVY